MDAVCHLPIRAESPPKWALFGAGKEARTPDIHVGNVMLYQLSYSRMFLFIASFLQSTFLQ
jgi:hypothetical protein